MEPEKIYLSHEVAAYHGKTNSWGSRRSTESTVKYMRGRFENAKCDNEGVGDCVRCQVMSMVKTIEDMLSATNDDGTLKPDHTRQPNKHYQ